MQDPTVPTLRQLLRELSSDLQALAAQTGALARAEMRAATSTLKLSALLGAVGLVLVLGGLLVFLATLVLLAIALGLPAWAAAGTVALMLVAAGGLALWLCLARLRRGELALRATRSSVAETMQWLNSETRR